MTIYDFADMKITKMIIRLDDSLEQGRLLGNHDGDFGPKIWSSKNSISNLDFLNSKTQNRYELETNIQLNMEQSPTVIDWWVRRKWDNKLTSIMRKEKKSKQKQKEISTKLSEPNVINIMKCIDPEQPWKHRN